MCVSRVHVTCLGDEPVSTICPSFLSPPLPSPSLSLSLSLSLYLYLYLSVGVGMIVRVRVCARVYVFLSSHT